jgi:hypothetical protein
VKEQIFLKNLLYVINRFYHRLVFNIHQFIVYKQTVNYGLDKQVRPCFQVSVVN